MCFNLFAHQDQEKRVTTYLRILPSLLERDGTNWWRVNDWWSFLLHLELFIDILSPLLHSFFCHLLLKSVDSFHSNHYHACNKLVDNTYPKKYTSNDKGIVVTQLRVTSMLQKEFTWAYLAKRIYYSQLLLTKGLNLCCHLIFWFSNIGIMNQLKLIEIK